MALSRFKMSYKILFLIILFSFGKISYANSLFDYGKLNFQTIGDDATIPHGVITALYQDTYGFIWIGTQRGLIRFDGYQFVKYEHNPEDPYSITGNYITSLHQSANKLWIGTRSSGVSVLNLQTNLFLSGPTFTQALTPLANDDIRAISSDSRPNIYLGSSRGLFIYNGSKSSPLVNISQLKGCEHTFSDPRVRALHLDSQDFLWIGTYAGLCKIKAAEIFANKNTSLSSNTSANIKAAGQEFAQLKDRKVIKLFEGSNNKIWVGTARSGLASINMANQKLTFHQKPFLNESHKLTNISSIVETKNHDIWIATHGDGILVYDSDRGDLKKHIKHNKLHTNGINFDVIGSLLVDNSGLIWVGTWGRGLNKTNPSNNALRTLKETNITTQGLTNPKVVSMLELNKEIIWFGTWGGEIFEFDPNKGFSLKLNKELINNDGTKAELINALVEDDNGIIWIGTNIGLFSYSRNNNQITHFDEKQGLASNVINNLFIQQNYLWVATQHGLNRLQLDNQSIMTLAVVNSNTNFQHSVTTFALTADQTLWVGTQKGLYFISAGETLLKKISNTNNPQENISDDAIKGMLVTSKGELWISTALGIDRLKEHQGNQASFESINKKLTISNQNLGGNLIEDHLGRIWGYDHMIDPNSWKVAHLTKSIGWDAGTIWNGSQLKTKKGLILMGGTDGVQMLNSHLWSPWQFEAPLMMSRLTIDNQPQNLFTQNTIELLPENNSFSVKFSLLDYSAPEKYQYAYRLEGFDTDWNFTDSADRHASYTNVPPGKYTLRIKAKNQLGEWAKQTLNLNIIKQPSWFETTWAKTMAALLLFTGLYLIYRLRITKIKQDKLALHQLVEQRTKSIERLGQIGREITSSNNIQDIFTIVYSQISQFIDSYALFIGLVDNEKLKVDYVIENGQTIAPFNYDMTNLDWLAVKCVTNNKRILIKSKQDIPNKFKTHASPKVGNMPESMVYMPLVIKNQVIGCISVQSLKKNAYNHYDLKVLETICAYTSIAIDNAQSRQSLENTARIDYLTQLPNRMAFTDQAEFYFKSTKRNPSSLCIALADIDLFKKINDNYGHDCGDIILKAIAQFFRENLREQDLVARWGGEEFAFMFPNTDIKGASLLLENLRQKLAVNRFQYEDTTLNITATFGLASYDPTKDLRSTMKIADSALYQGKQQGRNRVIQF